ncbi:MAG: hypothetical protein AAF581_09090, partial [Planctomycetota bacterium]
NMYHTTLLSLAIFLGGFDGEPRSLFERTANFSQPPVLRIQTHLSSIADELAVASVNNLTVTQRTQRAALIERLRDYTDAGSFPQNTYLPGLRPVFVDATDRFCAVGDLMRHSGAEALARRIAGRQNFAFVGDITVPGIALWIERTGLTAAECARIQPTYCWTGATAPGVYQLSVTDATASQHALFTHEVWLNSSVSDPVNGWSFGICHDALLQEACGIEAAPTAIAHWGLSLGPPQFYSTEILNVQGTIPGQTVGAFVAVVHNETLCALPAQVGDHHIANIHYRALADTGSATVSLCDYDNGQFTTVPEVHWHTYNPAVQQGPNLSLVGGTATFTPRQDHWSFDGSAVPVYYDKDTGVAVENGVQTIDLTIASLPAATTWVDSLGFRMKFNYDPTLVTVTDVDLGPMLQGLNGGAGPDLFTCHHGPTAITVTVLNAVTTLPFFVTAPPLIAWSGETALSVSIQADPTALAGNTIGSETTLAWQPASTIFVLCEQTPTGLWKDSPVDLTVIELNDIGIQFQPLLPQFVRGDCNQDVSLNIADAVWFISSYLVLPPTGPESPCQIACDANGDGALDVADLSYLLLHLLAGGTQPPAPFPTCGEVGVVDCDNPTCP